MNKRAQKGFVVGMSLLIVLFLFIITTFALIEPFKERFDAARNQSSLNCPGTPGFDQTDYDNDTARQKLRRRPVCFITGITPVYFILAFLVAAVAWVVRQWRRIK